MTTITLHRQDYHSLGTSEGRIADGVVVTDIIGLVLLRDDVEALFFCFVGIAQYL